MLREDSRGVVLREDSRGGLREGLCLSLTADGSAVAGHQRGLLRRGTKKGLC